jgi:TQXA domain-containing protein/LPXTG-motif cell wall-anchored protein
VEKLRAGAALLGVTAIALMASAFPAAADAATAKASEGSASGYKVTVVDSNKNSHDFETKLFDLKVGKSDTLKAYCVDIFTGIKFDTDYVERPWSDHTNGTFAKNADKINWLLQHSYPQVSTAEIEKATKLKFRGAKGLTEQEAVTATQAAAWHFSDNVDLKSIAVQDKDSDSDVRDLYDYLTSETNNVGIKDQPKPELTLEPKTLTGKAGTLIGPFVASTSAENVVVNATLPTGVKITDKDGKELPKAKDAKKLVTDGKYEFFVQVPAEVTTGKADLTVTANATLTSGRLFMSSDLKNKPSQMLILANTGKVNLETKGEANWGVTVTVPPTTEAPAPQAKNELANTGASVLTPVIIGVVLVGAGVGALVFQRRRKA